MLSTTGYADDSLERDGGETFEVIDKPSGRMELARRVRFVLDGPEDGD